MRSSTFWILTCSYLARRPSIVRGNGTKPDGFETSVRAPKATGPQQQNTRRCDDTTKRKKEKKVSMAMLAPAFLQCLFVVSVPRNKLQKKEISCHVSVDDRPSSYKCLPSSGTYVTRTTSVETCIEANLTTAEDTNVREPIAAQLCFFVP